MVFIWRQITKTFVDRFENFVTGINLRIQKPQSNHYISKLLAYKYLTRIGKFQLISDKHSHLFVIILRTFCQP